MDVLSDVIAVMRTGKPVAARVGWQAPWSQEFAPVPGAAGFQVVLHGACHLLRPETEPLVLSAGDVVFLPHAQGHTLTGQGDTVTLCGAYEVAPARVHPMLLDLPEVVHLSARDELRSAIELLDVELRHPHLGTDALVPALLDTLLVYLLRAWFAEQPARSATGWAAALNDPVVSAALQAMHHDPARPWTVAKLAAEAGLSRAPFAQRFAALTGRPPMTYLTWWRMTIAARLLRESDAPLNAVAGEVGYRSEFAFAAAFKREHGVAPGRYRRAVPGGVGEG
ncbi:AraC family transcriptional regulator [Allokutzneria sp. A3M-2-11 16]|uniref:helix-turn-helix transcriptional regulator n=1 Tax=Allokutzneria sp. A3M-2-11 16 TaxID=2962043 RepID=UPI0020B893F1|nr:AraC family transcriptional regulator [Allokutzneria sp. A3M-2-11 16]MCP3803212.1 AraC family transcriptional regulator [Allokutzneria sp. A3M-2-11 16]